MARWQTLAKVGDVPEGEGRTFLLDQTPVGLFRVNGHYLAIDDRCPHAGAPLARGTVEDGVVCCPLHHWRFRLEDGRCLESDSRYDLKRIPIRIVGDVIEVELPEVGDLDLGSLDAI